jgi:hypothetical protein
MASARSCKGEELLDNAGMTKLGQNMLVRGTTVSQCARRAQTEEAAPGWKGNGKGNPKSNHYVISKAEQVKESGGEAHAKTNRGGGARTPEGQEITP